MTQKWHDAPINTIGVDYRTLNVLETAGFVHQHIHPLFELFCCLTPVIADNRSGRELNVHGKCPLQLAGYDVSHITLAHILRGQNLAWPPETLQEFA